MTKARPKCPFCDLAGERIWPKSETALIFPGGFPVTEGRINSSLAESLHCPRPPLRNSLARRALESVSMSALHAAGNPTYRAGSTIRSGLHS